jgi:tRNA dimethylallyltransferase
MRDDALGVPPVVVLLGPTAAGKTDVSIPLAERIDAEILVADSRQLYRGLDVGTGKPSAAQRRRVAHHLIDVLEPGEPANAARYAAGARAQIAALHARGRRALVVGGSGLYVRALLEGFFRGPGRDAGFRAELAERAAAQGWPRLHAELAASDPETAARIHANDAVRITRALEIARATGMPASTARRRLAEEPLALAWRAFGLRVAREELVARIARRFDDMLAAGLVDEVAALLRRGVPHDAPAFAAPGYREIVAHLSGEVALDAARARAITATARYAKRQMTWFRAMPGIDWIEPSAAPEATAERIAQLAAR